MEGTEILNAGVRTWAKGSTEVLKSFFDSLNIQHVLRSPSPQPSRESLTNSFGQRHGMIVRIGFKFPRHMVFVAKGVGKGVPISRAGSSSTTRQPKDWFNAPMDVEVDKLADLYSEATGDLLVNNINIR